MKPPRTHADVLILGQGLAGSTLAWRVAQRGLSAIVVDRGGVDEAGRPSSSRVAAGLITPATGKRLTIAEGYDEQWRTAREFYRQAEAATGEAFLTHRPAVRLFTDAEERSLFERRLPESAFARHARLATADELPSSLLAPHGAFVMPQAARLDVGRYLAATMRWLAENDRYHRAAIDPDAEIKLSSRGVELPTLGLTADRLVLCQGHTPTPPRWLRHAEFTPAKGEVLTIDAPTLRDERVIHRGVWIAPDESGTPGRYRVGSTYEWDRLDSEPTEAARAELLARLAEAGLSEVTVADHQAAVRPAMSDRRPIVGFSAAEPRLGWLNGLGAKGSLWAPTYADRMAGLLAESLPSEEA